MSSESRMPRYTRTAVWLHWLMAVLIAAAFALGLTVASLPGLSPSKLRLVAFHKWIGVTVFLLAGLRLLWRLRHTPPPLPDSVPTWQQKASQAVHVFLYLLFFAIPISGYFYSLSAGVPVVLFGLVPLPVLIEPNAELKPLLRSLHFWLNMTLLLSVAVHVLAALKHHLVDRDQVLQRMLP